MHRLNGEISQAQKSNKEVLEAANAAITKGNFEGFLVRCTDDTVWSFEGDIKLQGKAAVREWMKTAYREPPRFSVHRMIAEDDYVVAMGEITLSDGKGKSVQHAYCDVWRFRKGKMAELRAFVVQPKQDGAT